MKKFTSWFVALGICVVAGTANCKFSRLAIADDEPVVKEAARAVGGLLALYDFRASDGAVIKDRSGVGSPLDLRIADPKAVVRIDGALEVRGSTLIHSEQPATKLTDAIRRSGEITIEAWVRPAKNNQSGPARIVSLSKNANERNFTLGQDGDRFDVRLRTSKTSTNGIPSVSSPSKSAATNRTHVVYTRDRAGRTRMYIDGQQRAESTVAGGPSNWDGSLSLALANEHTKDRPWLGTFYLVAIYGRGLSAEEVRQNFEAGADAESSAIGKSPPSTFETQIAPLLVRHCFECHDTPTKKGGLDLSRKVAALAGGDGGPAIVPGKAGESLLWQSVVVDEMPQNRTPLSADEKTLLRDWIDAGAVWSTDVIDPAIYVHDGRAASLWVQRLTVTEYIETVRAAVGVDIGKEAREILPPDLRADGFSNTAYNLNVDLKHVDAYAQLAEIIVQRMDVLKFAGKFSKSRSLSTDNTMRELVAAVGKWLLRGPLDEREITNYSGVATTVASAGGDFEEAVSYIIEAMLQSPRFIYRIENQRGDGSAWPVGQYELASRLSYVVWGGPPDEALIQAAEAGDLAETNRLAAQVRRMLADPRAKARSAQFIHEWLDLGRLSNLRPDSGKFPHWNARLASDMREETLAFFEDVVWKQNRPLADLLNAQVTYATPRLATHYGLELNENPREPDRLARVDLSGVPGRGGLLTQGSVLTVGGDEASMVSRGLFVLHDLLRGSVKDPPPCVDTNPVPTKAGLTQRGIAEGRIANTACGGCHAKFEPLAFGLEKFDGLGAYHDFDRHGNKLRDDGEILFPGTAEAVPYKSSAELMNLLAGSQRVRESITWKLAQFSLGRPLVANDATVLDKIHRSGEQDGGTYASLITAIVTSDLVRMTRTEAK